MVRQLYFGRIGTDNVDREKGRVDACADDERGWNVGS